MLPKQLNVLHDVHTRMSSGYSIPTIYFVYAASLSRRNPSFSILMATLWSRLIVSPQSHIILRLDKSLISGCTVLQQLQIYDDGNHLSTLTRYLFLSDSLYSSMFSNMPYPLSSVALPLPKLRFAIERIFMDPTQTTSY